MILYFEFDPQKAQTNLRKHGITFEEAITVFNDPLYGTEPDPEHSTPGDDRFRTFGYSSRNRILAVIHNEDGNTIRIISARLAEPFEIRHYEND